MSFDADLPYASVGGHAEAVVGIEALADLSIVSEALLQQDVSALGAIPRLAFLRVRSLRVEAAEDLCKRLAALPFVRFAEPNVLVSAAAMPSKCVWAAGEPNDTSYSLQWHLSNVGQGGAKPGADIEAGPAWEIESGNDGVVVAVVDTGMDFQHPEFLGRVLDGYDFVDEDADPTATNPHGLYVAGVIGACSDNAFGVCGIARRCRILPVRVLGPADVGTNFDLMQGIDYATTEKVEVLNLSIVGSGSGLALKEALEDAVLNGVAVIAAAGNGGPGTADDNWPSASPYAMAIGATSSSDVRAPSSATGSALDFVAPGIGVVTVSKDHDDTVKVFSGTSASAPMASGIAALLKAYNPSLTHQQVYTLLRAGAEDQIGDQTEDLPGWDPCYGWGRLNALRSLQALCSCSGGDPLTISPKTIGPAFGGTWLLRLDAGVSYADQPYLMLGSVSVPGVGTVLGQTKWPISFDAYTRACLFGGSPLLGNVGKLDAHGSATAALALSPAIAGSLAGVSLAHAAAVYSGSAARPFLSFPLMQCGPVTAGVDELPSQLFTEDFEADTSDWSFENGASGQWHVAVSGECGALSRRAAYNKSELCAYVAPSAGHLVSPSILMSGLAPYRLRLSSVVDVGLSDSTELLLRVVDESNVAPLIPQSWKPGQLGDALPGTTMYEIVIPESVKYEGRRIHLEFTFLAPKAGGGIGWAIDEVSLWNSGTSWRQASK